MELSKRILCFWSLVMSGALGLLIGGWGIRPAGLEEFKINNKSIVIILYLLNYT
jgi:hypothetical protein